MSFAVSELVGSSSTSTRNRAPRAAISTKLLLRDG